MAAVAAAVAAFGMAGCGSGGGATPAAPTTLSESLVSTNGAVVLPQDGLTRFDRTYTFTASSSGLATVTLSSTDFVPLNLVYIGLPANFSSDTVPPGLQVTANANGSAQIDSFDAVAGEQYFVLVSSQEAAATGQFSLSFSENLSNVQPAQLPPSTARLLPRH